MRKNIGNENKNCTEGENFDTANNDNEATATRQKLEANKAHGSNHAPGGVDKLLRLPDVLALFPVGRSTWYDGVRKGIYPQPVRISSGMVAWSQEAIQALVRRLATASAKS